MENYQNKARKMECFSMVKLAMENHEMKIIFCFILLCLLSIPAAPAGQSFDVLRLDLGPDFYNSLPLANGYQWTARGRVYPAGTMAARPPCVSEIEAPAIGNYLIRGLTGNQSEHLAVYAVRLNVGTPDLTQYIFSGLVQTGLDAEGFPRLFFCLLYTSPSPRD